MERDNLKHFLPKPKTITQKFLAAISQNLPTETRLADQLSPKRTGPLKALMLISDPVLRRILTHTLEAEGLEVVEAKSPSKVTVLARRCRPGIVFLDAEGHPGILATLSEIRNAFARTEQPVLMMALDEAGSVNPEPYIVAGADDSFPRPLVLSEIRARIKARAKARRLHSAESPKGLAGPGTVLDNKYRLEEVIGSGNFGMVYRAVHLTLEKSVAIKILHPRFSERDFVEERLVKEGVSTCQIDHPNAVSVLDLSLTTRGEPYLVMELLKGKGVDQALDEATGGRLTFSRAIEILLPVCEVLAEVHRMNMLHLDIKPANIFLHQRWDREIVKVLDFGVVRMITPATDPSDSSSMIETSTFEGTPPYSAPERLLGEPFGPKADTYSVGVCLYEMLAGRRPYHEAKSPIHLVALATREKFPPLDEVGLGIPGPLKELCSQLLASNATARPSAREAADALMQIWAKAGSGSL